MSSATMAAEVVGDLRAVIMGGKYYREGGASSQPGAAEAE
jgi:hypothetical protein